MPDLVALRKPWVIAASGLVIAALPGWMWGPRVVGSILAGGLWNLASLWCLTRLLGAWLRPEPSRNRLLGWLALKGAWLALLIGAVLRAPWLSFIGFGIGFTIMLIIVIAFFALHSRRFVAGQSHGR